MSHVTDDIPQNTEDKHRRFSLDSVTEKPMTSPPSRLKSLFAGIGFGDDYSDDFESDGEFWLIELIKSIVITMGRLQEW